MDIEFISRKENCVTASGSKEKSNIEKKKDVDLAFVSNNIRFRANIFQSSNGPAIVLRKINDIVPEISSLNLPPVINDVIREKAGLILVTGATGFLGASVVRALLADKNVVRVIIRKSSDLSNIEGLNVETVLAD